MCVREKNDKHRAVSDQLNNSRQRVRERTWDVKPRFAITAGLFLFLSAAPSSHAQKAKSPPPPPPPAARPQREIAPATSINVDASEPMFTTMCALLAAGFEADISAENWRPLRAQLRDRMQHQQCPADEDN